jgi:predicted transcriptional regulator
MRVEEIMSVPVTITKRNNKVTFLKDLLSRKNINALPVLEEDGTITGIVSSSDVAKCHDENELIQNIMSDRVHIVLKNNRVKDAAAMMVKNNVHHLVVMEEGNVVGMVSSMDIIKVYAEG